MQLTSLLANLSCSPVLIDGVVSGLTDDSREVRESSVFIALNGSQYKALDFVNKALLKKPLAIIIEGKGESQEKAGSQLLFCEDLRALQGTLFARYHGYQPSAMQLIGVTGTNGKTSIAYWLAQCLEAGYMGTLGNGSWQSLKETINTTSSAKVTHQCLERLRQENMTSCILEVSSHALVQKRLDSLLIETAVFTNLSHEHLDYHGDMDSYYQAKKLLFTKSGLNNAVINLDCEYGLRLFSELAETNSVGFAIYNPDAAIHVKTFNHDLSGISAEVATPQGNFSFHSPFLCEFNLSNLLAVIAVLNVYGWSGEQIKQVIERLKPVKGRMEKVHQKPWVVIDYAHTPDALEKALKNISAVKQGKLFCVFGCGGDRDKGKRPIMGAAASRFADKLYITNDNPRTESPEVIAAEVLQGVDKGVSQVVELDRARAIRMAFAEASTEDVILIAGKGHEDYQIIGQQKTFFSDHLVVEQLLSEA